METEKAWNEVLYLIRKQIDEPAFETWFKHCYVKKEERTWYIISPNTFGSDWLEGQYLSLIKGAIYEVTNEMPELLFTSKEEKETSFFAKERVSHVLEEIQKLSAVEWDELYNVLISDGLIPPTLNEPDRLGKLEIEVEELKSGLNKLNDKLIALEVKNHG